MGGKTSKRSVDITTTPKKGDGENLPSEGEGKVEKIGDLEAKVTTNGGIHTEIEYADKEETEKDDPEPIKDNGVAESEGEKTPELTVDTSTTETLNETAETEKLPEPEKNEETPESSKKNKEKSKKKKWSFRSISFSKKEKSKPDKDAERTDDVKETAEEEEKVVTCPIPDEPKVEGEKQPETTTSTPITNGEVIAEEPAAKTEECKLVQSELKPEPEPVVEPPKPVVESKPSEVVEHKITEVPESKPAEPEIKPIETESKPVKTESKPVEAESKPVEAESKPVKAESKPVEAESKPVEVEQKPTEVAEPKPVVEPVIAEERKEVRSEEIPPPLPASNPPSPVTVFAESTMAEVQVSASVVETIPEPVSDSIICEKVAEHSAPVVTECSPLQLPVKEAEPVAQSSPVIEHKIPEVVQEAPPSPVTEQILNADSLPDISTESLPSLPEPLSESLPEPMSLPPVDCVPEPIAKDATEFEPIPNIPLESEAVVLTNGEANGLSSPVHNGTNDDTDVTPPSIDIDRPLKQVIPASETIQNERQDGDKQENIEPTPVKVEE